MVTLEDIEINDGFLELFRELIHEKLGIYISKDKDYLLTSKIGRLMKKYDYKNVSGFYQSLKDGDTESFERLVRYITTTHTFFFREESHLKILRNDILLRKIENPIIWCAACSTGEEVYSIVIELYEHKIYHFLLIATDINRDVLIKCKRGIYHKDRVKDINKNILNKYFIKIKGEKDIYYKVKPIVKKNVIIKKINLIDNIRFEQKINYIFCRNVLIYFNRETQQKVIQNLIKNMDDLGYLLVGHSESLLNITHELESVFSSVYNKKLTTLP